jgi:hypothetical protein
MAWESIGRLSTRPDEDPRRRLLHLAWRGNGDDCHARTSDHGSARGLFDSFVNSDDAGSFDILNHELIVAIIREAIAEITRSLGSQRGTVHASARFSADVPNSPVAPSLPATASAPSQTARPKGKKKSSSKR